MVETHDPAGWYPDPTGKHELRYWDGYAWLDNVSDQGATSIDPLGGTPQPPPSQVAAQQQQQAAAQPTPSTSKAPIIIGAVVAAVVVIAAAAFFLTRDGDDDGVTTLTDDPVTFSDEGEDSDLPTIHTVKVDANHAVTITVNGEDDELTAGIIVEAEQGVVDAVNSQISDASDVLGGELKDECSNLREEDIGAQGKVAYFFRTAFDPGEELKTFVIMPAAGDFEFVPVLIDDNGDCKGGKLTMTLEPLTIDLSEVSNLDDLASVLSDDPGLSEFFSS